jgi:Mg2+/Co2+ transporter CorB
MYIGIGLLVLAALSVVTLSSLFALIESSILITDDIKLQLLLNRNDVKDKTKKRIEKIILKKDKYLTAMGISSTFVTIIGSSMVGIMSSKYLTHAQTILFTIGLTYFMLVFAKTLPKIIASYAYERILIRWSWVARTFYFTNYILILLTLVWIKILRLDKQRQMSINELKMIIKYYRQNGIIEKTEQKLLEKIFNVKQNLISDVMDKFETQTMDYDHKILEYKDVLKNTNNKRFLVRKDDQIVGVVFHRDITSSIFSEDENEHLVSDFCRQTITLSFDDNLMDSIVKFKENSVTLAVVFDETDKAIGTVTIKQIYNYILSN